MNMLTVPESPEPHKIHALNAASNVIPFPKRPADPYNTLTAQLVVERSRRGELPEAVLLALMASAGLHP